MKSAVKLLLDAIKERGLKVAIEKGRAVFQGDKKEVTPELVAAVKHWKTDILSELGLVEIIEKPLPPQLWLRYADGFETAGSERITEQPVAFLYDDEKKWVPIPANPF